jgi:hypothetical protein
MKVAFYVESLEQIDSVVEVLGRVILADSTEKIENVLERAGIGEGRWPLRITVHKAEEVEK